jgi:hypothetical protein
MLLKKGNNWKSPYIIKQGGYLFTPKMSQINANDINDEMDDEEQVSIELNMDVEVEGQVSFELGYDSGG